MVEKSMLEGTPMYEALKDLAEQMDKRDMPPVELNVIGGFALMLHGVRPSDGVTDIDYVGTDLSENLNLLIEEIGRKHGMEPGWINKDGMATNMDMDDFEFSTGELHFVPAISVGGMNINVLEEKDLLRLKVIAVDTAMTELEATGEFVRIKDFHDIYNLMHKLEMAPEDVIREFDDYMICYPDTGDLVHAIANNGPDGGLSVIEAKRQEFKNRRNGSHSQNFFDGLSLDGLDMLLDNMIKEDL